METLPDIPATTISLAGHRPNRLKRQTKTLGGALGAVITELPVQRQWSQGQLDRGDGPAFNSTDANLLSELSVESVSSSSGRLLEHLCPETVC